MKPSSKTFTFWIPLALIAALGFGLVLYCTVWGGGLISDSFQYIASARNLSLGKTLGYPDDYGNIIPLTQYPPFFSVTLTAFEMVGVDSLEAARWLNAVLFAANIWLVGVTIFKISHSRGYSFLGALLTALSAILIEIHAWVLSEALYIFLSLLAFYWLGIYVENYRTRWLVLSALTGALALSTRYVGLAILPVALIYILWKGSADRRTKWLNAGVYSLIFLLPMMLWSVRNYVQSGQLNNRTLQWVPITIKNISSLVSTMIAWFIPENLVIGRERWAGLVLIALFIGFVVAIYIKNRKSSSHSGLFLPFQQPLFLLHGVYVPCYIGMVIVSKMFFDNNIGMTNRMFSPLMASMLIPGCAILASLWQNGKSLLRFSLMAIVVYGVVFFTVNSAPRVDKFHRQGIGLARKTWHTSEVIQSLPEYASLPIYSNSPSTLYFWTGRMGGGIPVLDQAIKAGSTEKAIMVIFYHVPSNARINRLVQVFDLVKGDSMAKIYMYEP